MTSDARVPSHLWDRERRQVIGRFCGEASCLRRRDSRAVDYYTLFSGCPCHKSHSRFLFRPFSLTTSRTMCGWSRWRYVFRDAAGHQLLNEAVDASGVARLERLARELARAMAQMERSR